METLKKTALLIMAVLVVCQVLVPTTGYSLNRAPGAPSVIVLDGRTEPPISARIVRAETKPRTNAVIVAYVPVFGPRLAILPTNLRIARIWK
jgi:hypothetical protein